VGLAPRWPAQVVIEQAETPIKSVELQLVRVESIIQGESTARERKGAPVHAQPSPP
jgi:hypothetical protein